MNAFDMPFSRVYACLVQKAGCKGRTRDEVDSVQSDETSYGAFIDGVPAWNPCDGLITGQVCGIQVETIADPRMKKLRQLDKLVDELARGKPVERILNRRRP